jgi:multisubunit Na+/H+ antiporter MnhC subunit
MVDIGAVWDRTVEFVSDNLSAVVPIALIGTFVPLTISASLAPLATGAPPGEQSIIYGAMILLSLWTLWGKLGIVALAMDPHGGRPGAVQMAGRRLLPAIGASLLLLVGVIVAIAPIFIALQLGGFDFAAAASGHPPEVSDGVKAPIGLYGLALCVIFFWVGARLCVLLPTIVMERRGLGVFARCFRLTRGIALKLVGVVLLYVTVSFVSQKAAQFVFGALLGLMFGGDGPVSLAAVLTSILVGVVATAFTVLSAAFTAKLYRALRDARESIVEAR